jgi:hypothetical protein
VVARYRRKMKRRYFRGDAAFANPDLYEFLEAEGFKPGFPVWPAFCWRESARFGLICSGLRHRRWRLHGTPGG